MKEVITSPEKEDKFTPKDKLVGALLIFIITFEIIILFMEVKKEKEKNHIDVTVQSGDYTINDEETKVFPIEIKCGKNDTINIESKKGSLFNNDNTITSLDNNLYTVNCKDKTMVYWTTDESIEIGETITLKFKKDKQYSDEQIIKIKKDEENKFSIEK